ncbi:hypothetical protein [Ferrimonas balearica]|uniref:hypothetical protein n=1 Tax=Ferrimonas balearica TaxID=44012 RepID=UPI001C98F8CA|nr:hypothetical protein [Ferrimonas balearica]MBY5991584.1 hypothetical protein [Ferrimonas balearica]
MTHSSTSRPYWLMGIALGLIALSAVNANRSQAQEPAPLARCLASVDALAPERQLKPERVPFLQPSPDGEVWVLPLTDKNGQLHYYPCPN